MSTIIVAMLSPRFSLPLTLVSTLTAACIGRSTSDGAVAPDATADRSTSSTLGSLRDQEALQQGWLAARLDRVLPLLMRERGVDMWIVAAREYNEDPVFASLVSPSVMAARRTTLLVFFDRGLQAGVERLALGGGSNGGLYEVYRDPNVSDRELIGDSQWALLRQLVETRQPQRIAIDVSTTHAFADGLTSGLHLALRDALGPWSTRLVGAETLPIDYLYVRLPEMLPHYRQLTETVHEIISTAFSEAVIEPGVTTTEDVQWWMRERVHALGFGEWFPPDVDVQRPGQGFDSPIASHGAVVIERGDMLHCDFGLVGWGLATDTQHLGYVLREGETDAPAGLYTALRNANRLQDIVTAQMAIGRTGNEVLAASLAAMRTEGIDGTVYTHPIGDHGHGAGPLIGLWDHQEGVPGRGDLKLRGDTWYAIELQATTPVPEWGGQRVRAGLEEDAVLDASGRVHWVVSRQEKFHLVQ